MGSHSSQHILLLCSGSSPSPRSCSEGTSQRGCSAQEMEGQENPEAFKSSRVCVQEHKEELTGPTGPQTGEKLPRVSREAPQSSPEEQQPGASWQGVQQPGWDGWDVTAVPAQSSSRLQLRHSGMALG